MISRKMGELQVKNRKLALLLGASLMSVSALAVAGEEEGKIYLGSEGWAQAEVPFQAPEQTSIFSGFAGLIGQEAAIDLRQLARNFIEQNAAVLRTDENTSWGDTKTQFSPSFRSQRLSKTWKGLPVLGGDAVVVLKNNKVAFANADATDLSGLASSARVRPEEARSMAYAAYQGHASHTSAPELKVLILGSGAEKKAALAYEITVNDRDHMSSDIHYVSADTGRELMVTTNVQTLTDRQVLAANGDQGDWDVVQNSDNFASDWKVIYADKGCGNGGSAHTSGGAPVACNSLTSDVQASAKAAWDNSGMVYDYYQAVHKRNSVDDKGLLLKSVVNFVGPTFKNAAWFNDKSVMLYGVGDGTVLKDFAAPLDIAGHEMTHGMTSRTANLAYVSESGALNESYSDVFGKLIAMRNNRSTDWKIGSELFVDSKRFIRDLENPQIPTYDKFKYKGEFCSRENDFCGVHINSGIPNRVAVLIAKKIGNDKMEKLYYLTLTQLLRRNSDFKEARAQTTAACGTLFGASSADCQAVKDAYTTVGIL
jgi:Zn-dependent metalloprotease